MLIFDSVIDSAAFVCYNGVKTMKGEKKMKRFTTVLLLCLLAVLMLTAVSCGEPATTTPDETTPAETTPAETTAPITTEKVKKDPDMSPVANKINIYTAFQKKTFTADDGFTLPYLIYLPADYNEDTAYPVLLFLHGAGERGTDNRNQLNNVIAKLYEDTSSPFYHTIVVAPQCPNDMQWVDTPWANGNYIQNRIPISKPLSAAVQMMDSLLTEYSINPNRQYVMGISMGGFGTWDLIMRYPDRFAAAVPICGGADPTKAKLLVDMPIWTFHDTTDGVVPCSGTQMMYKAMVNAGCKDVTYTETAQYGHGVWDAAVATDGLFNWMFDKRTDNK